MGSGVSGFKSIIIITLAEKEVKGGGVEVEVNAAENVTVLMARRWDPHSR